MPLSLRPCIPCLSYISRLSGLDSTSYAKLISLNCIKTNRKYRQQMTSYLYQQSSLTTAQHLIHKQWNTMISEFYTTERNTTPNIYENFMPQLTNVTECTIWCIHNKLMGCKLLIGSSALCQCGSVICPAYHWPHSSTALWQVATTTHSTAWWQRHICELPDCVSME